MTDADRNRALADLAQLLFATRHPAARRPVEETDERSRREFYAMAQAGLIYCERLFDSSARGDAPAVAVENSLNENLAATDSQEPVAPRAEEFEPTEPAPFDPNEPTGVDEDGTLIPF